MTELTPEPFWIRTERGYPMFNVPAREPRRKPSFFMIGAAKTATTSIAKTLAGFDDIGFCAFKEPQFFSAPKHVEELGIPWYEGLYAHTRDDQLRGEASTSYANSLYADYCASNVASYAPDAKIIYVVREPVARAESEAIQWLSNADNTFGGLNLPRHGDALLDAWTERRLELGVDPIATSQYIEVLSAWEKHFPRDRIHVALFEDIKANYPEEVSKILQFLDLPDREIETQHANKTSDFYDHRRRMRAASRLNGVPGASLAKSLLPKALREAVLSAASRRTQPENLRLSEGRKEELAEHFRPYNDRLRQRLGRDLPSWS